MRLQYAPIETSAQIPAQFLIIAPKRHFPAAHDRNFIKRCIREAVRKEKNVLNIALAAHSKNMAFAITYTGKQKPIAAEIHKGVAQLFSTYIAQL